MSSIPILKNNRRRKKILVSAFTSVHPSDQLAIFETKMFSRVVYERPLYISKVSHQNSISLLYIMLEIHHSGRETSICEFIFIFAAVSLVNIG